MKRLAALLLVALPALGQVGPSSGAKPGTCPTGQFMFKTSSSANPSCAVPGAGGTVLTTKGDVLGFSNTAARIPVGANGTALMADSSATLGVSYQTVGGSVSCFSSGVGSPEGVVTAVTGCTYVNTSNSDIYTKAYGSGNTGWVLTTAPGFLYGAGSPEGAQVGYIGDLYLRTSNLHWFQKQTGDGTNTGWVDLGTSPPPGGGRRITGVGTPNRLAYWTGASVLGFSTATWNNSTGALTATTFVGALTGNADTATLATNANNTAITNDTTTNATMFPTWVTANTGNLPQKVTSDKFTFNPSTGQVNSTIFSGSHAGTIASATTGTTQSAGDNSTKMATTEYVKTAVATLLPSSAWLTSFIPNGRLSLASGDYGPLSTSSALVTYYVPYGGSTIPLYFSGSWYPYVFTEKSIKATDSAQTGTMTNGTKVITGLTDTSQLVRGMQITGTSVGAASVIATIDSATQVTGTVNSTGSTTNAVTFKLVQSTLYDICAVPTSTTAFRLQYLTAWTSSAAGSSSRALAITIANAQDGVLVNDAAYATGDSNAIAAKGCRYIGTIMTDSTAGQISDNLTNRNVANLYNALPRSIVLNPAYSNDNTTTTYNTTSTTWTAANTGTGATGSYVSTGFFGTIVTSVQGYAANSNSGSACYIGIGNSSTANAAWGTASDYSTNNFAANLSGGTIVQQATGYNTISLLVRVGGNTCTYIADGGRGGSAADVPATQLIAWPSQ